MYTALELNALFLPGYASTSAIWHPVCDELAAGCTCTLLDWPRDQTRRFHSVEDFARWLPTSLDPARFDFIVGHSMGGLVGLELLVSRAAPSAHLVLVESFLASPAPFFRNLVLKEGTPLASRIVQMLRAETPYYSSALPEQLRSLDATAGVIQLTGQVSALYGDRGCNRPERVAAELCWPKEVATQVPISVIPDACHFPMLESPSTTAQVLRRIFADLTERTSSRESVSHKQ